MSLTEPGTIWLVRDFPPLFLFAQPDSWMAANWGRGSLAAAAESNALMPLTLFHSHSFSSSPPPLFLQHTHTQRIANAVLTMQTFYRLEDGDNRQVGLTAEQVSLHQPSFILF